VQKGYEQKIGSQARLGFDAARCRASYLAGVIFRHYHAYVTVPSNTDDLEPMSPMRVRGTGVLELKNKGGRPPSAHSSGSGPRYEPLSAGRRVRDLQLQREGAIVDVACQYAHPKADPVYNYLIRWDDGQVQAFGASAFEAGHGLEPID
jgi:hypothetical protein